MADNKYGRIFTEADVRSMFAAHEATGRDVDELLQSGEFHFPATEPVFVLRAQDRRALGAIRQYDMLINSGVMTGRIPTSHSEGVRQALEAFEIFRKEHADRLKEPD